MFLDGVNTFRTLSIYCSDDLGKLIMPFRFTKTNFRSTNDRMTFTVHLKVRGAWRNLNGITIDEYSS